MEQRVSLVTLGVSDLARARRFYEDMGWSGAEQPDDEVCFFQAGGSIIRTAGVAEWGGTTGAFADPDGYVWQVAHNPGWTINADGSVTI